MSQNLEFKLINSFVCKRCGCTHYDKEIFTGNKLLDEENSIIHERYVCRNCDLPFDISKYKENETVNMTSSELLKEAVYKNEGIEMEAKVGNETITIKENENNDSTSNG